MKYIMLIICLSLFSCASREEKEEKLTKAAESVSMATADMHSSTLKGLKGKVDLKQEGENLVVSADVQGLRANRKLGFHIHENGVCEGPDYKSAGDHFNPDNAHHGAPDASMRHRGDMGNLQTDKNGNAVTTITLKKVSLSEIIGKAILIHEKADDLKSQPSGNSGKRIACGLIRPVE